MNCTRHFRKAALELYPSLLTSDKYRGLFSLLCFGSFFEPETNCQLIFHDLLAKAVGEHGNKSFRSGELINDFKRDVLPNLSVSGYDKFNGQCRKVEQRGFSQEMDRLLERELKTSCDYTDLVDFVSGQPLTGDEKKD